MADTSLEVQTEIVKLLKASNAIAAIVKTLIYDTVPDKTDFPFINIPPFDSATEETKDKDGQVHDVQIDTWSRTSGQKQTRELIKAIRDAVHRVTFTISDATVLFSRVTNTRVLMDSDKRTIHGIIEMQIKVLSD